MGDSDFERMLDSGLTDPYFTYADGWSQCGNCGEWLQAGDFIQRPKWRPKSDRTVWHYDCTDPSFSEGMALAREDESKARARGSKSRVNAYWFRHAKKERRR